MSAAKKADNPVAAETMPSGTTSGTPQLLLTHHLKQLRLPTILREYDKVAREAAREGIDHTAYLLRLRKANALYFEFEEIGMNRQLGYSSPADLIDKYPAFFLEQCLNAPQRRCKIFKYDGFRPSVDSQPPSPHPVCRACPPPDGTSALGNRLLQ